MNEIEGFFFVVGICTVLFGGLFLLIWRYINWRRDLIEQVKSELKQRGHRK